MENNNVSQVKIPHKGLILSVIVIIGVVFTLVAAVVLSNKNNTQQNASDLPLITNPTGVVNNTLAWEYKDNEWVANGTAENCKDPVLQSPSDVSLATGILYSGQFRGPYKAHGGLNFNGGSAVNNAVDVKLAITGKVIKAARYIQTGEVQYLIDFMSPCGIIVRYDHLLTLSDKFQAIIETLPEPILNDSRTTDINNGVTYQVGELIATRIGFESTNPPTTTYDFGVYDLRKKNEASKDPVYFEAHKNSAPTDFYGVCWLDYLPAKDEAILRTLPVVSGESGTKSDYCKSE